MSAPSVSSSALVKPDVAALNGVDRLVFEGESTRVQLERAGRAWRVSGREGAACTTPSPRVRRLLGAWGAASPASSENPHETVSARGFAAGSPRFTLTLPAEAMLAGAGDLDGTARRASDVESWCPHEVLSSAPGGPAGPALTIHAELLYRNPIKPWLARIAAQVRAPSTLAACPGLAHVEPGGSTGGIKLRCGIENRAALAVLRDCPAILRIGASFLANGDLALDQDEAAFTAQGKVLVGPVVLSFRGASSAEAPVTARFRDVACGPARDAPLTGVRLSDPGLDPAASLPRGPVGGHVQLELAIVLTPTTERPCSQAPGDVTPVGRVLAFRATTGQSGWVSASPWAAPSTCRSEQAYLEAPEMRLRPERNEEHERSDESDRLHGLTTR